MKKTLLTIFSAVLLAGTASAQCNPDPQYASAEFGLWPDSAEFVDNNYAVGNMAYSTVIDIKTLKDTTVETTNPITGGDITIDVWFKAFRINEVQGIPPGGFTYSIGGTTVANDSTWLNTGSGQNVEAVQGCLQIDASAAATLAAAPMADSTNYPMVVVVDAQIEEASDLNSLLAGKWLSELSNFGVDAIPIIDYVLRVYSENHPASVTEALNAKVFDVAQSYPNPAGNEATITFTTPRQDNIEVKVFNMLGATVFSKKVLSESGVNNIKLNTARMSAGMYIYTVSNGTKTFTKKMTVK